MRPTLAIACLTLAVAAGSIGITEVTGFAGDSSAGTIGSSQNAITATRAVDATPGTHATSSSGTPRTAQRSPAQERRSPPQRLAPRPPADGRDAPDPFLLEDRDRWVLYTTQVGLANIPVSTTPDLATWSTPTDALPQLPAWAQWGRTWAPGVLQRPGGFVLYFAAGSRATGRQCIGAATSTSATGPFTSTSPEPLVCQPELGGSIDPHPFVDADGTTYLLWKADGNAIGARSTLFSQRLRPDGLALEGRPTPLVHNDAAWEEPLIENPAFVPLGGRYVLLYSGGWWESDGYATGYATCDGPLGPCAKVTTKSPLHTSDSEVAGPGGACVITGPAGDLWLAHHAWTPGAIGYQASGARSLHFTALRWDGSHLTLATTPPAHPTSQ
jgi:Glycosyl hydrolases family 43